MAFVQAKCINCGGLLKVDPEMKSADCPHCGVTYTVEDSINYYNSITKVENLHADVVNIADEKSSEGLLKAADAYVKLGKYSQAKDKYEQVTNLAPQNWRGWCGLIVAGTHEFKLRIQSRATLITLEDYARSAEMFATDGECNKTVKAFREYAVGQRELNKQEVAGLNESLGQLEKKISLMDRSESDTRSSIRTAREDRDGIEVQLSRIRQSGKRSLGKAFVGADLFFALILKIFIKGLFGLKIALLISAASVIGLLVRSHFNEKKLERELRVIDTRVPEWTKNIDSIKAGRLSLAHEKESLLTTLKAYE